MSQPKLPKCERCGKHPWFQKCPVSRKSETKVIWTPQSIHTESEPLPEEQIDYTFYEKQKTKGDFFYCCSCSRDFFSEERYPYKCLYCGSRDWDNPNQWKGGA